MRILLDTSICIYLIKNNPPEARQHFERFTPGDIGISSVSAAELRYGVAKSAAKERDAAALEAFLLPLEIVPFDSQDACVYGTIRAELEKQGRPIGVMDMVIAAQAVARRLTLISHNVKEFARVPALQWETWL
jgi:tRNA(fMet)-specific endonuclease VapC